MPVACTPHRDHALVGTPFYPIAHQCLWDPVNILVLFLFLRVKIIEEFSLRPYQQSFYWTIKFVYDKIIYDGEIMKVKIKVGNKFIERVSFAEIDAGNKSYIIALDENNEKLKKYKIIENKNLSLMCAVFFFECPSADWIEYEKNNKIQGYDWFLKDENAIKCNNKLVNSETLNRCVKMQSKIKIKNVFNIKTQKDIDNLLYLTDFHDAYVKSIIKKGDTMYITLDTTWGIIVHFKLSGNPKTNLLENYGSMGEIFDSTLFFENGKIYWVNDPDIQSEQYMDVDCLYFCAEKISYTVELE